MLPKILIISETFKSDTGGGITLTNLFKDYPRECLANAVDATELLKINQTDICDNFYSIGLYEKKTLKIFSFLQKKGYSGKYIINEKSKSKQKDKVKKESYRALLVDVFFKILHFIGIYHLLYRYEISPAFKIWLEEFKPDYIYTQLSARELIHFTEKIRKLTNAKVALHIMDDWPSTISRNGFLKKYWQKKIDKEFKELLSKASILMSISEGMSDEYKRRYNKVFIPFHNPIEVQHWLPYSKNDVNLDNQNIKILYAGRIGLGTSDSIIDIANAIEELCKSGLKINFHIQTTTSNSPIIERLKEFSCVRINPVVKYSDLPKIFSGADLLVMPIDFTQKGIQFLKYSMPTKASEYMISGTPILLYCDPEVSMYNHAKKHGWASIVSERNNETLKNMIVELISNIDFRFKLSKTAKDFAKDNFDSAIVRKNFMNQFK